MRQKRQVAKEWIDYRLARFPSSNDDIPIAEPDRPSMLCPFVIAGDDGFTYLKYSQKFQKRQSS